MLQDRPHLDLEADPVQFRVLRVAVGRLGDPADVVEGEVAETVDVVGLALVDGVGPVDLEETLQDGRDLVHVIDVEGNHAEAEDVRDIQDILVFATLEAELAGKGFLFLDAVLQGGDDEAGLVEETLQFLRDEFRHLRVDGEQFAVLREQFFGVRIQRDIAACIHNPLNLRKFF